MNSIRFLQNLENIFCNLSLIKGFISLGMSLSFNGIIRVLSSQEIGKITIRKSIQAANIFINKMIDFSLKIIWIAFVHHLFEVLNKLATKEL